MPYQLPVYVEHSEYPTGVREIHDATAYLADHPGAAIAECGECQRMWDDSHASEWTPAPSGRCPFEYDHYQEEAYTVRAVAAKVQHRFVSFYVGLDSCNEEVNGELCERPAAEHISTVREIMAAEYGQDWTKENYRTGISHVVTFFEGAYRTEYKDLLVINGARANERHGYDDRISVSNYRVLEDNWKDSPSFYSRGPWSNVDAIALELDEEAPEDLTETIHSLEGYPVLDDDEYYRVEEEMIQEHWEGYGADDTASAVAEALGLDSRADLTDYALEVIKSLVFDGITSGEYSDPFYPFFIDDSAVDFNTEEVARWISVRAARGGMHVSGRMGYRDGPEYVFDLRTNAIVAK